jgi:hypothetical protein
MFDPIDEMRRHTEELRELLQSFDLELHNDEGNEDKLTQATAALDTLEGHINDLTP